jgi:hypothetical protein
MECGVVCNGEGTHDFTKGEAKWEWRRISIMECGIKKHA